MGWNYRSEALSNGRVPPAQLRIRYEFNHALPHVLLVSLTLGKLTGPPSGHYSQTKDMVDALNYNF